MNMEQCKAYEQIRRQPLPDIQSEGVLLRHKKSGARICLISNSDDNKVFYIGFRTPPGDSTGAAHIVEHTVLCGSQEFPVKDPFVELVKGSLNTFLNAMTYPDKTLYPVASVNDTDFKNLMHVYLDAVFRPNIYKQEEIFRQEGWHYELGAVQDDLTINGVVYNEMKGACSSPDSILSRQILQSLNPDNAYAFSAAGDPEQIPKLTYGEFLDFHRKYYHPSNSYLYLYGNMDMEERLNWIDQEYLCQYGYQETDSGIPLQKPFLRQREVVQPYGVPAGDTVADKTCLSLSYAVDTALNEELCIAFHILEYALLEAPGAPVKQALLDAGIGKDIESSWRSSVLQPIFSVVARNSNPEKKDAFLELVEGVLAEQAEGGLNKTSLLAGLNRYEFQYREADFGRFPKGLLWGIRCMDTWLYDDSRPFQRLEELPLIQWLRDQVDTGYFEGLIVKYLLQNPHRAVVVVEPRPGYGARLEQAQRERLLAYRNSLSQKELEGLVADTAHLQQYQKEPSAPRDLLRIPLLSRADLNRRAELPCWEERSLSGCPALYHPVADNGIAYLSLVFDAETVAEADIPYLGILKAVLGYMDTKSHTYQELANETNLFTGGIGGDIRVCSHRADHGCRTVFLWKARTLVEHIPKTLELMGEMLAETKLTDRRRLYEILARLKAGLKERLASAGDAASALRALSYVSLTARHRELVGGIEFYRLVCRLEEHYEEEKEQLARRLEGLMGRLFRQENLLVSVGGQPAGWQGAEAAMPGFLKRLQAEPAAGRYAGQGCGPKNKEGQKASQMQMRPEDGECREASQIQMRPEDGECREASRMQMRPGNEGFLDASQVQYVSRAGNFKKAGFAYTGALKVLTVILEYEYLWQKVRIRGGAYGCRAVFSRNGDSFLSSYRDPNLEQTNRIYEECPAYLRAFTADEREMTKYVVGAVSELDRPKTPAGQTAWSLAAYLKGLTKEELQRERDQVLAVTQEDIRALAPLVEAVLAEEALCVIGNEDKLKEQAQLFRTLETI